jgi:hypothetical protein
MRAVVGALVCALALFSASRAEAECYYVADSALSDEAATAAAEFAFPWRIGQPATDESRAVHDVFVRTIEPETRSFGRAWFVEQTEQGRRYIRPNGIVIEFRGSDCSAGLVLVRTYLHELGSIAPGTAVRGALLLFSQNAREVSRNEYDGANPPTPVAVERPGS